MRAVMVEVGALFRHQIAGMAQVVEQVFVQQFIAQPAIEAFNEPVLHSLPGRQAKRLREGHCISPPTFSGLDA